MKFTIEEALQKAIDAHKVGNVREADFFYTAILKAQPQHPDANHNMGVLAVGIGKSELALPFFRNALEANPNKHQFWKSLIEALIKLKQFEEAKDLIKKAQTALPDSSKISILVKTVVAAETKEKLSIKKSKRSLEQEPQKSLSPELKLLVELFSRGNYNQVITKTKKLVEQFPLSVDLFNIRGASYASLKEYNNAIKSYKHAIKIKPNFSEAFNNLGNVHRERGEIEEALQNYQQAIELKPDYSTAYYNMGNALNAKGELNEAIKSFEKALEISPDYSEAYYNMGNALNAKGELNEALNNYEKSVILNPNLAEAYINIGIIRKDEGKPAEAIKNYKKALNLKPNLTEGYINIGIILKDEGKLEEAIKNYKKALSLNPNLAEAHNNIGNALTELGRINDAIQSFDQALRIKKDYATAHNNRGTALYHLGKLDEAIASFNLALQIRPKYPEAHFNLGNAFRGKGQTESAIISFKQALKFKPNFPEALYNMASALKRLEFTRPNPFLHDIIISIFEKKTYIRPVDISMAAISLLKHDPNIKNYRQNNNGNSRKKCLLEDIKPLARLPLLIKLMSICPIIDFEFENILANIRSQILKLSHKKMQSSQFLRFQSALALQCFINEYIYLESDDEKAKIKKLEAIIEKVLLKGQQPDPHLLLCLASYKALNKFSWSNLLIKTKNIEEVFTQQLLEPMKEDLIKGEIRNLENITDTISLRVRGQYEDNPYPRWVNTSLPLSPDPISTIVKRENLLLKDRSITDVEHPTILIAGCGTGQHSITTATEFKNSKVLAIDLSLSSLAYAKRKTEELGIKNIEYMQADILSLTKLKKKFDIIESTGVLHHMDDPLVGWKILVDCLKSGGLMRIGLYSELARKDIVKVRKEIKSSKINFSGSSIKAFRNDIINSGNEHHRRMSEITDFYTLSSVRDLLFHVQEHRFSIFQIKNLLSELGLNFSGFIGRDIVRNFKKSFTDAYDPYNLDKWETYERANKSTFTGMYQFWCQKISDPF